jgi:hypothetical protein
MKPNIIAALLLAVSVAQAGVAARDTYDGQEPRGANTSPARPADEPRPLLTNVQVELTVTDSIGSAAPQKKTVSMLIADGRMGRIRSMRDQAPAILNVDATPTIHGNQVRLQLTLEYSPPLSGEAATRYSHVNEMVTLMLQPGKPTLVSQAADPSADRKVTVEVTATILK